MVSKLQKHSYWFSVTQTTNLFWFRKYDDLLTEFGAVITERWWRDSDVDCEVMFKSSMASDEGFRISYFQSEASCTVSADFEWTKVLERIWFCIYRQHF